MSAPWLGRQADRAGVRSIGSTYGVRPPPTIEDSPLRPVGEGQARTPGLAAVRLRTATDEVDTGEQHD